MRHVIAFKAFLTDEVNLNKTRLDYLNDRVSAVTSLLKELDSFDRVEKQGSYALGTIIKPINGREYDADILLYMQYSDGKGPKDYIEDVYAHLKANKTYEDKVHRRTRCVYIDYKGEFHLDIVPCIAYGQEQYICNRHENTFEITDGTGFREWLNEKNRITDRQLKKVTKLLKYLRDHKGNFSVKSILLTTLIGQSVYYHDEGSENFNDIPTALKMISNRINSFLQSNEVMPEVFNPVLPQENFTRHWDQDKYRHFREMFSIYTGKINDAYDATDHNASINKWRELFGDNFGELRKESASVAAVITPSKPYAE